MSITDNTWSDTVRNSVVNGKNAGAFSYSYHKGTAASNLVLWAESHDTFADGSSSGTSVASINKTWALIAARADAMGLYLARPANMSQTLGTASVNGWSYAEVGAVNQFHNAFIGQKEYVSNQNGIAYVERGTSGVVLVNCKGTSANISVTANTMKNGTYTDQITGNTFKVSGGKITGTIGSTGIAVVYNAVACNHPSHDTDGFCTKCGTNVGHSYDASGKCVCGAIKIADRTIYFTNSGNWSTVNFYSWYTPENIISSAWPGDPMTKVDGKIYSCTVPADAPNIIFNNGTKQTEDIVVPSVSSGKNMYDFATGKWSTYTPAVPDQPSTEVCTHPAHTQDGLCSRCFAKVDHTFKNSICTVCGVSNEPPVTEPQPTDPAPIDPTPTDPTPTDPIPTEPESKPTAPPATEDPDVATPTVTTPIDQSQSTPPGDNAPQTDSTLVIILLVVLVGAIGGVATVILIQKSKSK